MSESSGLEVSGISVSYGRHRALDGVSLRVAKGEICVILGANGAGKTTLLNAIAGRLKAGGARISMNGRQIANMKPHAVVEEGVALVPEGRGIFGELSVIENLRLGAYAKRARESEAETLERVLSLFPRLGERRSQIVRTMSGGEQQMVAIGRALMSNPEILMLDEPSLGLSPILSKELFRSLKAIGGSGMGILLVEQNARLSLAISDRGYLLENGHIVGEDNAAKMLHDPAVQRAYLGGAASAHGTDASHRTSSVARPHIDEAALALPPVRTQIVAPVEQVSPDAAALAGNAASLVARAASIQADYVRDGAAASNGAPLPPTADADVLKIIDTMEAAARRARLAREAEASLPPANPGAAFLSSVGKSHEETR